MGVTPRDVSALRVPQLGRVVPGGSGAWRLLGADGAVVEPAEAFVEERRASGVRPYGSGCSHEHACIRCDFLQVQPAAVEQLRGIEVSFTERIKVAQQQAWLGDVEQLRVTLDRLHDKQNRLHDLLDNLPSPTLTLAQPALTRP